MNEKLFDLIMANIEENANFEGHELNDVVLYINLIGGWTEYLQTVHKLSPPESRPPGIQAVYRSC